MGPGRLNMDYFHQWAAQLPLEELLAITSSTAQFGPRNGANGLREAAIHSLDRPASFSLDWNGLKFVFGSDT
ncbi:MAG: hypothetical protein WCE62_01925 [Polyangiales bacterium]